MSLNELMRDRSCGARRGIGTVPSKEIDIRTQSPSGSKDLYRQASRAANRESVQPNMGRVHQQKVWNLIRCASDLISSAPTPQFQKTLERFQGFVESIEGSDAYVTLATERGESFSGLYPAAELAAKGVHERDRFRLTTTERDKAVLFDIQLIPRREITAEMQQAIRERIERELDGYTPSDDY